MCKVCLKLLETLLKFAVEIYKTMCVTLAKHVVEIQVVLILAVARAKPALMAYVLTRPEFVQLQALFASTLPVLNGN